MTTTQRESQIALVVPPGPVVVIDKGKVVDRDKLLGASYLVTSVESQEQMTAATATLSALDGLHREVTKQGESLRKPFTELSREIKRVADTFLEPLDAERKRIGGLIADEGIRQRKIAEDLERQRREQIDEHERKAAEERRAAMQAMARAKTEAEYDRLAEETRLRNMANEAKTRAAVLEKPIRAETVAGLVVKSVWKFEVVDLALLPKSFTTVTVAPNKFAIQAAIDNGVYEIPGCKIWESKTAHTRSS